jgi:hypothetical protein
MPQPALPAAADGPSPYKSNRSALGWKSRVLRRSRAALISSLEFQVFTMRAETERTISEIKQALSLLRRHL